MIPEAHEQTAWISIPGCPGRFLRIRFLTEITPPFDGGRMQETTSAIEAGAILAAMQSRTLRTIGIQFTPPE